MNKSDFTFRYTSISPISNEGRICKVAYKNNFFAEIEFDYDDIAISFLDSFIKKCKQIAIVDYTSRPKLNTLKQIDKHAIENAFFKSDVYNIFKVFGKLFEDKIKMNNETLSIKFTNLTSVQKATLQQMFAYLQECTRQGASRNIGFFWDAGWGMHGKIISEEITSCKVPLTPISSSKDIRFFNLSDGQTRKAKIKFDETDFINPWFKGADLKGCPFCGEMANLEILGDEKTGFSVVCRTCGCQCTTEVSKEEAIATWNTRKDF